MLKKYALQIAIVFTLLLTVLSFMGLKGIPKTGLSFEDKLFHFIAYLVMAWVWFNYLGEHLLKSSINKAILISVLIAVAYGIIVEVLQERLTINRVTEFNDIIANTIGAITAGIFIKLKGKYVKKY